MVLSPGNSWINMLMEIRIAEISDAPEISSLMAQLGYSASSSLIEQKLKQFTDSGIDEVFVAVQNEQLIGAISCHITSLFHQAGRAGRITSLIIDENSRGSGVGRLLVEEAEKFFRKTGCIKAEVTSGDHRLKAHAFYESCGYIEDERRFLKQY